MTSLARTTAAAAAAALALTGCSMIGGDDDSKGGDQGSSSPEGDGGGSGGDSDGSGSDELDQANKEAGVDPKSPPKPVASVTMPGSTDADQPTDMTVDLISLKRQDELMVLTVGVTPDKKAKGKADSYFGWTGTSFMPQVVDTTNLKVHNVVKEKGGGYVYTPRRCPRTSARARPPTCTPSSPRHQRTSRPSPSRRPTGHRPSPG